MTAGAAADLAAQFARDGHLRLPYDPDAARWAEAACQSAARITRAPKQIATWLRCAGTWFAGVDVLDNAPDGSVAGVPLVGPACALLDHLGLMPARWHAGQVSVVYRGYPRPREGESETAARYRMRRDAAHVDGLLPVGPNRARVLREAHGFILGLPLNETAPDAGPLVVWSGSHRIIGPALAQVLSGHPPAHWGSVDLTAAYRAARRQCFETCARVPLPARPGQAILLHRHLLHGMAPWPDTVPDHTGLGRMIAYFRPLLPDHRDWPGETADGGQTPAADKAPARHTYPRP